jgi:hypothetical protein
MRIMGIVVVTGDEARDKLLALWLDEMRVAAQKYAKKRGVPLQWNTREQLPVDPLKKNVVNERRMGSQMAESDLVIFISDLQETFLFNFGVYMRNLFFATQSGHYPFEGTRLQFVFVGQKDPEELFYRREMVKYIGLIGMQLEGFLWFKKRVYVGHTKLIRKLINKMIRTPKRIPELSAM